MSTSMTQGNEQESPSHSTLGNGRYDAGKWYCGCVCDPAKFWKTYKTGPNYGRKFWRCSQKLDVMQCSFLLWADDEAAAKEWLSGPWLPRVPQTRAKTKYTISDEPAIISDSHSPPETPLGSAKRKGMSIHYPDGNGSSLRQGVIVLDSQHTRKSAKISTPSTPSRSFIERLQGYQAPLPSPDSRERRSMSTATLCQLPDASPTPGRFNNLIDLRFNTESDLATNVLELIRPEIPKLKASTETQLRHEIGLRLDVSEAELRRHRETISELRKRIDELEKGTLVGS